MRYWDNAKQLSTQAAKHTKLMFEKYSPEIFASIANTHIYQQDSSIISVSAIGDSAKRTIPLPELSTPKNLVIQTDTVSALFHPALNNKKVAILNFASYKSPGGLFLKGSSAQEESLCHSSFLYNVLSNCESYYASNKTSLNKGLYSHKALVSPDVRFFKDDSSCTAHVITCAAPNYSLSLRYKSFSKQDNDIALAERISFIKTILSDLSVDTAILGAWGCGVFKQNPKQVASLWKENGMPIPYVVYAIPDTSTYNAFNSIFN